jgi:hypothetical protein
MTSPLVELALTSVETSDSISSDLVKEALEEYQKEQKAASGKEIIALLKSIDSFKLKTRAELRKVRATEKKLKASLDAVDRAWKYAEQTNNFLPVLALFNQVHAHDMPNPDDFEKLTTVPADWEEKF